MKGTVRVFKDFNGYGFAAGEDNYEYFLHVSEIRTSGFRTLEEGQEIDFTPGRTPRGLIARDIIPVGLLDINHTSTSVESDASTLIKKILSHLKTQ